MEKIIITALILLLLVGCIDYNNHSSIVKINTLDGKTDTININYTDYLYIDSKYELLDRSGSTKAYFVRNFSQLQTK